MSESVYLNIRAIKNSRGNAVSRLENMFTKYRSDGSLAENSAEKEVSYYSSTQALRLRIEDFFDPTAGMTETQKERFIRELYAKIQSGRKLTPDEMQYLRRYDPVTYLKVARIQAQREALEKRLEGCESKEEARELYADTIARIPENDPARKELKAAYDRVYEEFKESAEFRALPEEKPTEKNLTEKNPDDKGITHNS